METGAFLLPSRITRISSTSSATNSTQRGEDLFNLSWLRELERTHRPVADDDLIKCYYTTSAQLYLGDIRSENMSHADQLIFIVLEITHLKNKF